METRTLSRAVLQRIPMQAEPITVAELASWAEDEAAYHAAVRFFAVNPEDYIFYQEPGSKFWQPCVLEWDIAELEADLDRYEAITVRPPRRQRRAR